MKIQILSPCGQSWDKMITAENGRHCLACDKVVIDFTAMTTQQIKTYFQANCGKKTCGRFMSYQLDSKNNRVQKYIVDMRSKLNSLYPSRSWTKLVFLLMGFLLVLSGCERKTGETSIVDDSITVEGQNTPTDSILDNNKK